MITTSQWAVFHVLSARYNAHSWQIFGEASYRFSFRDSIFAEPFAGLSHTQFKSERFIEHCDAWALRASPSDHGTSFSTLGVRGGLKLVSGVQVYGSLGWCRAFGDINPSVNFSSAEGEAFSSSGAAIARDVAHRWG